MKTFLGRSYYFQANLSSTAERQAQKTQSPRKESLGIQRLQCPQFTVPLIRSGLAVSGDSCTFSCRKTFLCNCFKVWKQLKEAEHSKKEEAGTHICMEGHIC